MENVLKESCPLAQTPPPLQPSHTTGEEIRKFFLAQRRMPAPLAELQVPSCLDEKITASLAEQYGSLQNLICESIQQLNAKIDKLQGALSTGESKLETMSVKII